MRSVVVNHTKKVKTHLQKKEGYSCESEIWKMIGFLERVRGRHKPAVLIYVSDLLFLAGPIGQQKYERDTWWQADKFRERVNSDRTPRPVAYQTPDVCGWYRRTEWECQVFFHIPFLGELFPRVIFHTSSCHKALGTAVHLFKLRKWWQLSRGLPLVPIT